MTDDDQLRVNPGYALQQLQKALEASGGQTSARVEGWEHVLAGLFDGSLKVGSRTPVAATPAWVTLEVIHGGFATGGYSAGGPLEPHELSKLSAAGRLPNVTDRAVLNAYYVGDEGRAELLRALRSGCFRINVPEEAALLVTAWLIDQGEGARAEDVLAALSPFFDTLRFYPVEDSRPFRSSGDVHLESAAEVVETLRAKRPQVSVLRMNEAILVWTPLYDRATQLFVETVDGELPSLRTSEGGTLVRDGDGNPVIDGGWPCRVFPDGWRERAAGLLTDYEEARATHQLCGKPERPKENFARLRGYIRTCIDDPDALTGRDVGMIRKIVASYVTKHGAPGSDLLQTTRQTQARDASMPTHTDLARVLADRIAARGDEQGVPNVDRECGPLTASEAAALDAPPQVEIPSLLARKALRCLEAPIDELVARGVITSGETIGGVLPALTAQIRSEAIADPQLRRLYEAVYAAFRRRRSLLLLDLESQVRLGELPWVAAISPWVGSTDESRRAAAAALERTARLTFEAFPQTIVPNTLVRELRTLAITAGRPLPLVDELAADIFMGTFSATYLKAAQMAGSFLTGTLYERYYGLSYDRVLALDDLRKLPSGTHVSPGFADICNELAGVHIRRLPWHYVARNGTIIEQAQILTTHNLASLICGLELAPSMRAVFPDLVRRCFEWICHRLQLKMPEWRAELQTIKNCAYAWRQMIFYASLVDEGEMAQLLSWCTDFLATQNEQFSQRFMPALAGLRTVAAGGTFGRHGFDQTEGGRRFLGWSVGHHWLQPAVT